MTVRTLASLLCLLPVVLAHPLSSTPHQHDERRPSLLQSFGVSSWSHPESHPAVALFKRQAPANGSVTDIGSPTWAAQYPATTPDVTKSPDSWKQALATLTSAGLIPNIPQTTGSGVYPSGTDPTNTTICNSASDCRGDGDIWDAPDGMIGISFDDGPLPTSPPLYDFLKANSQKATHFFIGSNIRDNYQIFLQAFNNGNDIACHTWSHRYMTSLTNEEIVAEIGWTLQITSDLTGGRVPRYWRPPYGDSDNRVRAIVKHIFGLVQVDWNRDTDDWELDTGKVTPQSIATNLNTWITGPKSPGLIILEHELLNGTVQAFIDAYPAMKANNWTTLSIPDIEGATYYQNAKSNTDTPIAMNVINAGSTTIDFAGSSALSASSTASVASALAAAATASATPANNNQRGAGSRLVVPSTLVPLALAFALFFGSS